MVKVKKNSFYRKVEVPASGAVVLHPRFKDFTTTGATDTATPSTVKLSAGMNPVRMVVSGSIPPSLKYGGGKIDGGYFRTYVSGLTLSGNQKLPVMEMYKVEEGIGPTQGSYQFAINNSGQSATPPTTPSTDEPMVGNKLTIISSYMDGGSSWLEENFDGADKTLGDFDILGDQGTATLSLRDAYLTPTMGEEQIFQGGDNFMTNNGEGDIATNLKKYFSSATDENRIYVIPAKRNRKEGLWTTQNDRRSGREKWGIYKPYWKWDKIKGFLQFRSRTPATDDVDATKQASERNTIFDHISVQSPIGNIYTATDDNPLLTSAVELSTEKKVSGGQSLKMYHMWQHGAASGTAGTFTQVKKLEPTLGNRGPINPQVIKAAVYDIPEPPPALDMGAFNYQHIREGENITGGQTVASGGTVAGSTTVVDTGGSNAYTINNPLITVASGAYVYAGMTVKAVKSGEILLSQSTVTEVVSNTKLNIDPPPPSTQSGITYTFSGPAGYPGMAEGAHLTDKRLTFPEINITMNISKLFPSPQIEPSTAAAQTIWGPSGTIYCHASSQYKAGTTTAAGRAGANADDRLMWTATEYSGTSNIWTKSRGGLTTLLRSVAITFSNYKPDPYPTLDEFLAAALDSQYWIAGQASNYQENQGSNGWSSDTANAKYASGIMFQSFYGSSEYGSGAANDQNVNPESVYAFALPMARYNEAWKDMGGRDQDGLYTHGGFAKFDNAGLTYNSFATEGGSMTLVHDLPIGLNQLVSGGRQASYSTDGEAQGNFDTADFANNGFQYIAPDCTLTGDSTSVTSVTSGDRSNIVSALNFLKTQTQNRHAKVWVAGKGIAPNTYVVTGATTTLTLSRAATASGDVNLYFTALSGKPWGDPGSIYEPLWVEIPKDSWFNLKFVFDGSARAAISKGPNKDSGGGHRGTAVGTATGTCNWTAPEKTITGSTAAFNQSLRPGMQITGTTDFVASTGVSTVDTILTHETFTIVDATDTSASESLVLSENMTTASGGSYSYTLASGANAGQAEGLIKDYGVTDPEINFGVPLRCYISGAVSQAQADNDETFKNVPYINIPIPSRRAAIGSSDEGETWYKSDNSVFGQTNYSVQNATTRPAHLYPAQGAYKYMTIWVNNYRHTAYSTTDDADNDWTFWRGQYYNGTSASNTKYRAADSKIYPNGLSSEAEVYIDNINFKYWNNEHINHSMDAGSLARFITLDSTEILSPARTFWTSGALNQPDGTVPTNWDGRSGGSNKVTAMLKGFDNKGDFRAVNTGRFLCIGVDDPRDLPLQFNSGSIGNGSLVTDGGVDLSNDGSAYIRSAYFLFNNFSASNFGNLKKLIPDIAWTSTFPPLKYISGSMSDSDNYGGTLPYDNSMTANLGASVAGSNLAIWGPYIESKTVAATGSNSPAQSVNLPVSEANVAAGDMMMWMSGSSGIDNTNNYGFVIDNHGAWFPTASSKSPALYSNRAGWAGRGYYACPVSGVFASGGGATNSLFEYVGTLQNIPVASGTTQAAGYALGSGGAINMGSAGAYHATTNPMNWPSTDGFTQKGFVKIDIDQMDNSGSASPIAIAPAAMSSGNSWPRWAKWAPRENILASAKITGVPSSVGIGEAETIKKFNVITVDDPTIFSQYADDRYVIFSIGSGIRPYEMLQVDDAFTPSLGPKTTMTTGLANTDKALGYHTEVKLARVGSPIQGNQVALTVTDSGAATPRPDGVLRADDGLTPLCNDKNMHRLWISPLKYWINLGFFSDNLEISRQYESVCSINQTPSDGQNDADAGSTTANFAGSTFNESSYSYATGSQSNKGESGITLNPWILDSSYPDETSLDLQDYGYGDYDKEDGDGGQAGIKGAQRNILNYMDISGIVTSDKRAADGPSEPVVLTFGMNNLEATKEAEIYSDEYTDATSTNIYKPAFIWRYHDDLPQISDFKVEPAFDVLSKDVNMYDLTSENINALNFTWKEQSDGDIWYRMLITDSGSIQNKYHKARLWIPLNETPNETIVTFQDSGSRTWYSDINSSIGLTSGACYGGERALQSIEGLAGYAPKCLKYFTDNTFDTTNTSTTLTIDNSAGIYGSSAQTISGSGIPLSTTIASVGTGLVGISAAATATATNVALEVGAGIAGNIVVSGGTTSNKNKGFEDLSEWTYVMHITPDDGFAVTSGNEVYLVSQEHSSGGYIKCYVSGTGITDQKVYFDIKGSIMTSTSIVPSDGETPMSIIATYMSGSSDATDSNNLVGPQGPDCQLFINGQREDYVVTGSGHLTSTCNFVLGGVSGSSGIGDSDKNFSGLIEEVILYEKRYEVVPAESKFTYATTALPDTDSSDIAKTYSAKLFLFDYHNIRGKESTDVCESNPVAWRTTI